MILVQKSLGSSPSWTTKKEEKKESNLILDRIENPIIKSKNINPKPEKEKPQEKPKEEQQKETLMDKLIKLEPGNFKFNINQKDKETISKKENNIITTNDEEMDRINEAKVAGLFEYFEKFLIDFNGFEDNYLKITEDFNNNFKTGYFNSYIFKVNNIDNKDIKLKLINIDNQNTSLNFSNGEIYIGFLRNEMFKKLNEDENINNLNKNKKVYFRFLLINNEESYDKFKELDEDTDILILTEQKDEDITIQSGIQLSQGGNEK